VEIDYSNKKEMAAKLGLRLLWRIGLAALLLFAVIPVLSALQPQHNVPFPHWEVYDLDVPPERYWGKDDFKPHTGSYSAWPEKGGARGNDPEDWFYLNDSDSWMVYGPFNLKDYSEAKIEFWYWNRSEKDADYFEWLASLDGMNTLRGGFSVSGDSQGWQEVIFDLTKVPMIGDLTGLPAVWVGFHFTSDGGNIDFFDPVGAFVDDIILKGRRVNSNNWEILMTEDFEGQFPEPLILSKVSLPLVSKAP
jgi:hypothetical protein